MEKKILIDMGPDFREQALKFHLERLDGLILTHTHYDHASGLDELRIFAMRQKKKIPLLLSKESLSELQVCYHYLFPKEGLPRMMALQILEQEAGDVTFEGIELGYFSYFQTGMKVNGFRIGNAAYVTDIKEYDPSVFSSLKGVTTLILSGRRWEKSKAHLSLEEGMEFAKKAGVQRTFFTHISHEIEHASTSAKLPDGFFLAYDGLELEL